MRRSRANSSPQHNLDSLVDIVSNIVGILVILAAFMALFGLADPATVSSPERGQSLAPQPKKLLIPWSHATNKNAVFYTMQGNRLLHFDLRDFYRKLGKRTQEGKPRPVTIRQAGGSIEFFPVTNQIFCLEFTPRKGKGETLLQTERLGSQWKKTLRDYPPENFYYFFWVASDSFEVFREVRKRLWERQYEVGWKPLARDAAMETCSGFEGSTGFQPQ